MKTIYFLSILLLPVLSVAQKNANEVKEFKLSFDYFKKNLTGQVKAEIDSAWDVMKSGSMAEFRLLSREEHKKLSDDHKNKLTAMRADSVITYLQRKRIHPKYIQYNIRYFENSRKAQCTSSNAQYREFTKNRKGETSVLLEKDGYARKYYHRSEELLVKNTCDSYSIIAGEDSWVYGNQGTVIKFPANCFAACAAKPGDEIEIFLCEYYTLEDLLLSGLTTTSAEQVIETGGTIYLSAKFKDKELRLKSDAFIDIYFPTDEKLKNGMETFDGKYRDGLVDWVENRRGKVRKVKAGDKLEDEKEVQDSTDFFEEGFEGEYEDEGVYAEVDGYLMKTNQMGYINCDRFYDVSVKTDLIVKCKEGAATEKERMSYRLVFADIKSIMAGYEYSPEGRMKFSNLPKGREAYVLAISIPKKGTPKLAYQKVKLGSAYEVELDPKEMSLAKLKQELSDLF